MGTKIISNQHIALFGGLAGSFPADWTKPSQAEMAALNNVSEATRFNSFGVNVQASDQTDDRALSDGAGSQARGLSKFGGDAQFYQPVPGDTTSSYAVAKGIFGAPNVQTIAALRVIEDSTSAVAAGDEFAYVMHTLTDAQAFQRDNMPGIYYKTTLLSQSDMLSNYIVPDGTTKVLITSSSASVVSPGLIFLKATYFGIDVTKQVTWGTSDATKLAIVAPGVAQGIAAGSATITATYLGNAATTSTTLSITIT